MAGPGPGDPDEQYDFLFKLVLVGDASVGKTCVVQRFKTGVFSERQSSTIGVDFTMKTLEIQGKRVKVGGPAWGPRAGGPLRPPRSPGSDVHRVGPCPWRVPLGGGGSVLSPQPLASGTVLRCLANPFRFSFPLLLLGQAWALGSKPGTVHTAPAFGGGGVSLGCLGVVGRRLPWRTHTLDFAPK